MTDLNEKKKLFNFLKVINPSEINIKKEEIFYREKYKEIINYLKLILTESKDLEIHNYFTPKGLLLIHVDPGIDLLDYLKLICSNFYIHYIELRESVIAENSKEFFENFTTILDSFDKILNPELSKQKEGTKNEPEKREDFNNQKLFVIDQNQRLNQFWKDGNLLRNFLFYYQDDENLQKLLNNNLVLIWINYDYEGILNNSDQLYSVFDYVIKVPILNKMERQQVFREFMEKNPKISFDVNKLVKLTKDWEVNEINHLLRTGILKHYINADLNTTSNEITDIIIELIESGEFVPYHKNEIEKNEQNKEQMSKELHKVGQLKEKPLINEQSSSQKEIINQIKKQSYSEFMLNQLYENAASENYNQLVLIIDKLEKKEPLEDNDRKILSQYPFILKSSPSKAQILLEKAKKRVDMITKSFGK